MQFIVSCYLFYIVFLLQPREAGLVARQRLSFETKRPEEQPEEQEEAEEEKLKREEEERRREEEQERKQKFIHAQKMFANEP
jgi:hypothetical protein